MFNPTEHHFVYEFPEFRNEISILRHENGNFAQLYQDYHSLDEEIADLERHTRFSDEFLMHKKQERSAMKSQLYSMLKRALLSA